MKLAGEIGAGVLVSIMFVALCDVAPIGAAIAVALPLMALLAVVQIGEWRDRKPKSRGALPMRAP